eukprot:7167418-Pyramimonas_sp.AAC.1
MATGWLPWGSTRGKRAERNEEGRAMADNTTDHPVPPHGEARGWLPQPGPRPRAGTRAGGHPYPARPPLGGGKPQSLRLGETRAVIRTGCLAAGA